jgi:hypothetical protein
MTLPQRNDVPTHFLESLLVSDISLRISTKLGAPESFVGFWHVGKITPRMLVPEATMHKNDCLMLAKNNVRMAGKTTNVQTISKATGGKESSHYKFGLCILAANTTHHPAASRAIYDIRQEESRT